MPLASQLVVLNEYDLTDTIPAFTAAISASAARVQTQGHPGIQTYRFYSNAETNTARATIIYDDPEAWIGHHDIAMPWPGMAAMHSVAKLRQVTILGPFTQAMRDWLTQSGQQVKIIHYENFAGGFQR